MFNLIKQSIFNYQDTNKFIVAKRNREVVKTINKNRTLHKHKNLGLKCRTNCVYSNLFCAMLSFSLLPPCRAMIMQIS